MNRYISFKKLLEGRLGRGQLPAEIDFLLGRFEHDTLLLFGCCRKASLLAFKNRRFFYYVRIALKNRALS